MKLATLAARQKRAKDWEEVIATENLSASLKDRMTTTLREYRELLVKCWEQQNVSVEDEIRAKDLERRLQELHGETRLVAGGPTKNSYNGRMNIFS